MINIQVKKKCFGKTCDILRGTIKVAMHLVIKYHCKNVPLLKRHVPSETRSAYARSLGEREEKLNI